jgi:uncharacterized protein (TIGR02246 family)
MSSSIEHVAHHFHYDRASVQKKERFMKRFSMVVFAFALITIPLLAKESSEAAIRATDEAFAAAWNKHDAKAMAAVWAKDGDLINPFGRVAKGRAEIEKVLQDEHSTVFKQSTYKPGAMSVRFIEPDIALAESDTEISGVTQPDGTTTTINVHIIRLVQKKDGKWWTVAARPVIYPPAPGPK